MNVSADPGVSPSGAGTVAGAVTPAAGVPDSNPVVTATDAKPVPLDVPAEPPQVLPDKRWFTADAPSNLSFYVTKEHDFFNQMIGLPYGFTMESMSPNGDGTYTAGIGGLVLGEATASTVKFGVDWRDWYGFEDKKMHPGQDLYTPKGFRFSFDMTFGKYELSRYTQQVTLSSQQVQQLGSDVINEGEESLMGIVQDGDFSGILNLGDAWLALVTGYDPAQDVVPETLITTTEVPYYRGNLTFWLTSEVYKASRPIQFGESISVGANLALTGFDKHHFIGLGLNAEAVPLRVNVSRKVRAELFLEAGTGVYMGYEPANLFKEDENVFVPYQFFADAQGSVGVRFVFGPPNREDVRRVKETVELFAEHPVDMAPGDGQF